VRHAKEDAEEMVGQDSFLDVVTNIVGILILLVMVVGMRASQAAVTAAETRPAAAANESVVDENELRAAIQSAAETEQDVHDTLRRAASARQETYLREKEREALHTIVAAAEQEIAARRAELNSEDQRDFDLRRQLTEAQLTLDELTREQIALVSQPEQVEEIEFDPTPIAREVTGQEVHLLLADDHVAIVPFEEMLELMKSDALENIWRLRDQDQLDRTVGPINGFRLRYWFVKTPVVAKSAAGTMMAGSIPRFSHCFFIPLTSPIGEPAAESLRPNSEVHQFLQRLDPAHTAVTIWTYPGNYGRLRELKRVIGERGFQTAVRPLPPGMPVGASRTGSKSLVE
jgi:hypothetical protein